MAANTQAIVPAAEIESRILLICGRKVMLDAELARLVDRPWVGKSAWLQVLKIVFSVYLAGTF